MPEALGSRLRGRLRLRTRLGDAAARVGWHVVPAARYDVTRRDYYSPLPDLDAVPAAVWDAVSPMAGIAFDVDAQFAWVERHLGRFAGELRAPDHGDPDEPRYFFVNGSFQAGDANLLYAMVRHLAPARVLELGSGFSTLVMAAACVANRTDGRPTELIACNPHPERNITGRHIDGLAEHREIPAQEIPLAEFEALGAGDVLFVDTTHTVKIGSEVNRVVLEVLPRLAPGVHVHFHDISLPYEYPRWLLERMGAWDEQYLLQAFLCGNDRYRVSFGLQALARADPNRLARLAPPFHPAAHHPTSFWIRSL